MSYHQSLAEGPQCSTLNGIANLNDVFCYYLQDIGIALSDSNSYGGEWVTEYSYDVEPPVKQTSLREMINAIATAPGVGLAFVPGLTGISPIVSGVAGAIIGGIQAAR